MKNRIKKLISNKKTILSIFLVSVIVSLIMLISLIILQDNLFIKSIKTINMGMDSDKITSQQDIDIKKDILLPFVKNYRSNNSDIFMIIGASSVILSMILSVVINEVMNKRDKEEIYRNYKYYNKIAKNCISNDGDIEKKIPDELKDDELINNLIKIKDKLYNDNKKLDYLNIENPNKYEKRINLLENENNELKKSYDYEKEKNEILFSQIENIKDGFEENKNDKLNEKDKEIKTLLDKILNNEKKNGSNLDKKIDFKVIEKKDITKINSSHKLRKHSKALKIYKNDISKLYKYVKHLCVNNKYQEALDKILYNLSENEIREPKFAYLLGYIYTKLNKNIEAKKYLAIVLSIEPQNVEARNLFGVIQYRIGNKRDAEQHFNMVIILDPKNKVAKENIKRIRNKESNKIKKKHSA